MSRVTRTFAAALILAVGAAACTVKETEAPPLAGPSELGLSLQMTATPDILPRDGASQASVQVVARGADGRPARAVSLRMEILLAGVVQDFGTLSSRTVVTGDDGIARLTYTAPPRAADPSYGGSEIQLRATPISSDYGGAVTREIWVRLTPPGVILPPNGAPVPDFYYSPSAPVQFQDIIFDASGTTDEGAACPGCTYTWSMGDGASKTGQVVRHYYETPGDVTVRLTVTDPGGRSASTTKVLSIGEATRPTAAFTYSPTTPLAGRDIFFNAAASTAAAGRRIVYYEWDFGSGRTASGVSVAKRYDTPGSYVVTLTVTDDAGLTGVTSTTVSVTP